MRFWKEWLGMPWAASEEVLAAVFMEVATFNKRIEECESFQDEFLFYMKNLPTFVEKAG